MKSESETLSLDLRAMMYRYCFLLLLLVGCNSAPQIDYTTLTVDQLRSKMTDSDPNVRWQSVFELERREGGGIQAVKELTALLDDKNVEVRRVTTQAFAGIFMEAKPPYSKDLKQAIVVLKNNQDADEVVRSGVRIALGIVESKQK
ncbi:HEAT repeat domain-containing protein [Gimesia maris]|uniref:HEAT repeat domain-containing protein n=1 Tax=Gimesia maris TaxID=122 RepID=UPI0032ECEA2F